MKRAELLKQSDSIQKRNSSLAIQLNNDLKNLKRKFLPKINKCKDSIRNLDYMADQNELKLDEAQVVFQEFSDKAVREKQEALEQNESALDKANQEILDAENNLREVEMGIKRI